MANQIQFQKQPLNMKSSTRSIEDVLEALQNAKNNGRSCALLVGAGCSVTAGIPAANGFVKIIEEKYHEAWRRAKRKTYAHCMGELTDVQRHDLIEQYVSDAKINWAHVCIALLMKHGYVDRILTTNFDPLILKACALLGEFPAVYDFAASQRFRPAKIPDKAVFHLHGQRAGFIQLNTIAEFNRLFRDLKPLFENTMQGRLCVAAGYSGNNDPVFRHLTKPPFFDYGLYWIGYDSNYPSLRLQKELFSKIDEYAYVGGFDADYFFVVLTTKLKIFPPEFLRKPFTHMSQILEMLAPYSVSEGQQESIIKFTRKCVEDGKKQFEETSGLTRLDIEYQLMARNYAEVISLIEKQPKPLSSDLRAGLTIAYIEQADELTKETKMMKGEEATKRFIQACTNYEKATELSPNFEYPWTSWGIALVLFAESNMGTEADKLFREADDKFSKALSIKPNATEALSGILDMTTEWAKRKTGEEVDRLYGMAIKRFETAYGKDQHKSKVVELWGELLWAWAKMKSEGDRAHLYSEAQSKFSDADKIASGNRTLLARWGAMLLDWSLGSSTEEEAAELFNQGEEKYRSALDLDPKNSRVYLHWGLSLLMRSFNLKTRKGVNRLLRQADEKLKIAVSTETNYPDALAVSGISLISKANLSRMKGKRLRSTLGRAARSFDTALSLNPKLNIALMGISYLYFSLGSFKGVPEEEVNAFHRESKKYVKKVEEMEPGSVSLILAGLCGRLNDEAECKRYLRRSLAIGQINSRKGLLEDLQFAKMKDKNWFKKLVAQVPE